MTIEQNEFLKWLNDYRTHLEKRNENNQAALKLISKIIDNVTRRYDDLVNSVVLLDCIYHGCRGHMIQIGIDDWTCRKCGKKAKYINGVMFASGCSGDWSEFYNENDILNPDYWEKLINQIAPEPMTAVEADKLTKQLEFIKRQKEFMPNYDLCKFDCVHYESSACKNCQQNGYYKNYEQKCISCNGSGWYDNTDENGNSIPCGACDGTGLEDNEND